MQLTKLETLLSLDRLANIIRYSEMVKDLEGSVIDYGVFMGGTLELLAKLNPHKEVIGIDSFVGMPPTTDKDFHKEGDFKSDYEGLYGYFKILYPNVELLKGFAPEIFNKIHPYKKFSLVSIDVDLYESVKCGLDFFYPRMVDGGVIICDDIFWDSVKGGEQALMEFVDTINPTFKGEIFYYPTKSNKQFIIVK